MSDTATGVSSTACTAPLSVVASSVKTLAHTMPSNFGAAGTSDVHTWIFACGDWTDDRMHGHDGNLAWITERGSQFCTAQATVSRPTVRPAACTFAADAECEG